MNQATSVRKFMIIIPVARPASARPVHFPSAFATGKNNNTASQKRQENLRLALTQSDPKLFKLLLINC
jgi:hypothetical protein